MWSNHLEFFQRLIHLIGGMDKINSWWGLACSTTLGPESDHSQETSDQFSPACVHLPSQTRDTAEER